MTLKLLPEPHRAALLERFLRYCRIDTQADEEAGSRGVYPSSIGQLELGRHLRDELLELGLADAEQTDKGIVYATLPATVGHAAPVVAWLAHVDTSPETSGCDVQPVVHENYDGGDIVLPARPELVIRTAEHPELLAFVGRTIITSDGTTLLGVDNKAGVAVVMQALAYLLERPDLPRGPVRVCFTCDEEIGRGVDHVDLAKLGAVVGYTLDGGGHGEIDGETFSADKATVTIRGINIHPSIGKGKMVNAVRLAGLFLDRLPRVAMTPEVTEGREGFIHPYRIEGGVAETTIHVLLRDFNTDALTEQAGMIDEAARQLMLEYPKASVQVRVTPQYRNMADGIAREPRALRLAEGAMRRAGLAPRLLSVRGGTDGAQLTAKGLPTPNLSTGEHALHSPLEWTCLEEMETAVNVLVELAQLWGAERA